MRILVASLCLLFACVVAACARQEVFPGPGPALPAERVAPTLPIVPSPPTPVDEDAKSGDAGTVPPPPAPPSVPAPPSPVRTQSAAPGAMIRQADEPLPPDPSKNPDDDAQGTTVEKRYEVR